MLCFLLSFQPLLIIYYFEDTAMMEHDDFTNHSSQLLIKPQFNPKFIILHQTQIMMIESRKLISVISLYFRRWMWWTATAGDSQWSIGGEWKQQQQQHE